MKKLAWNSKSKNLRSWSHLLIANRRKSESSDRFYFLGLQNTMNSDCSHEIKTHLLLGKKAMTNPDSISKKQRHHFADEGPCSQSYDFSSSHVQMWESDHKEGWVLKNWCFQIGVLEKTLVPWTARWPNQSILKEVSLEYSLEGPMLKLKFQ